MMQDEWAIRAGTGATDIIFVHGFLSDGESCWRHSNGSYWPALLIAEEDLAGTGIYSFTYNTHVFSGNYNVSDSADALKEQLRLDGLMARRRLVFVCHSMGGIVVRKLITSRAADFIDAECEIGLFLIASPSLGSRYAEWLAPIARLFGHSQADALRFSQQNLWLNDLDKEFQNLKESHRLQLFGKELIEDQFITLKRVLRHQVVAPFSGARYFGEPFKVPQSDHFSIAKPESRRAIQHRLLREFIRTAALHPLGKPERVESTIRSANRRDDLWKQQPRRRARKPRNQPDHHSRVRTGENENLEEDVADRLGLAG